MKILIVVDKIGSAIWRLAEAVKVNAPYFDIKVYPVHPKRNDADTLIEAQQLMDWCDVIDVHYWKSGEILRTSFPAEFNAKKKILFHFNPYDLEKEKWQEIYDLVVVGNKEMETTLPFAYLVPYAIDLNFFEFNENYTEEKTVHMSVARIESKKGVIEVARACKDLGYRFILNGRVSEPNYMAEIMETGNVEFLENVDENGLKEMYSKAAIHVCNSVDGFESGTLPILEAMASGVPVLTRNIGHVPDLFNGENMVVRQGAKDDMDDLKKHLKEMMENRELRVKIRSKAWDTVKIRDVRKMTRQITTLYYSLWKDTRPLVSIITPTYDRPEALVESLVASVSQDYGKFEIVIVDSGSTSIEPMIDKVRKNSPVPIKYVRFQRDGYTLPEARNRGAIEAQGKILVFCDDRLAMSIDAVSKFAENSKDRLWQWGVKDEFPKGFVENLSSIQRDDFINGGMFCERMDRYGGLTQETRTRFEIRQNMIFELMQDAKATSIQKTKPKASRRKDIVESKLTLYKMYG